MKLIMLGLGGFLIMLQLVVTVVFFWIAASTVTSGIKAVSKDCDKTYVIEKVVCGNWFCQTK